MRSPVERTEAGSSTVTPDGLERAVRDDIVRVGLFGTSAWLAAVLLPLSLAGPDGWFPPIATTASLLPLGLGAWALRDFRSVAPWLLLAAYPATLAAFVALLPRMTAGEPEDGFAQGIAALAVVVYGAIAAAAASRPAAIRTSTHRALGTVQPVRQSPRRRTLRRALLGGGGILAFAVAVAAPTWGGREGLRRAWGEAATEAGVLTAVIAGAVATIAVAAFLGPATRASRKPPPSRRQRQVRIALFFGVAALGSLVYWIVRAR